MLVSAIIEEVFRLKRVIVGGGGGGGESWYFATVCRIAYEGGGEGRKNVLRTSRGEVGDF